MSRTYRSAAQVGVHLGLTAAVTGAAWAAAFFWLPGTRSAISAGVAATVAIALAVRPRLRRAVVTDREGVTVQNEEATVIVPWRDVAEFRLEPRPGNRPDRAVMSLRTGEVIPLDGVQGTELRWRGHDAWRRRSIAELNAELARAHRHAEAPTG